jgi:ribonuclease HI
LKDEKKTHLNINSHSELKQQLDEYLTKHDNVVEPVQSVENPPWKHNPTDSDIYIWNNNEFKNSNAQYDADRIIHYINDKYNSSIKIYTDASKSAAGKIGVAVCVPETNFVLKLGLPDNISIYTAELSAIWEAIKIVKTSAFFPNVIFSDSLKAINDINSNTSISRPNLVHSINSYTTRYSINITLCWIPSHSGIGNEQADKAAKEALVAHEGKTNICNELTESYENVAEYVRTQWQQRWDQSRTGSKYKVIYPQIPIPTKGQGKGKLITRNREVMINRLRFHACKLNIYLFKIGLHVDGLCETCKVEESVEHFLTECKSNTELIEQLRSESTSIKVMFDVKTILTSPTMRRRWIWYINIS